MTELRAEDLMVHLTVDDARTAQAAGFKFARTLAGADPEDFAAALWEQEHLVGHRQVGSLLRRSGPSSWVG